MHQTRRVNFGIGCSRIVLLALGLLPVGCAPRNEVRQTPVNLANLRYFRESWEDARSQFLDLARKAVQQYENAQIGSFPVPGKTDKDLAVDWLYIPPTASTRNLVVITSGLHGIEGFPGSAIQGLLLTEYLPTADRANTGYLFIHGINAYGMRYGQRVTESFVDLNRNAPVNPDVYSTPNPGYRKLDLFLNPKRKVDLSDPDNTSFPLRIVGVIVATGVPQFAQSSLGGQYEFPKGLYYGGKQPEPQYVALQQLLPRFIAGYSFVLGLDLHSGVGRRSYLHVLPNAPPNPIYKQSADTLFAGHPIDWPSGGDFYTTSGDFTSWLERISSPRSALAVTVEFGTLDSQTPEGGIKSMHNTILANQGMHYGFVRIEDERQVQEDLREMFFPSARVWRSEVIRRARETLFPVLDRVEHREEVKTP